MDHVTPKLTFLPVKRFGPFAKRVVPALEPDIVDKKASPSLPGRCLVSYLVVLDGAFVRAGFVRHVDPSARSGGLPSRSFRFPIANHAFGSL